MHEAFKPSQPQVITELSGYPQRPAERRALQATQPAAHPRGIYTTPEEAILVGGSLIILDNHYRNTSEINF